MLEELTETYPLATGINRIIMEFKYTTVTDLFDAMAELIES